MTGTSPHASAVPIKPKPGGKRLRDIDSAKNDATGKASDVGRQSAFAGIAAIWLLSKQDPSNIHGVFSLALLGLVLALFVDFMQYVYCSWTWKKFYNEKYNEHESDDALVDIPDSLTAKVYCFFWIKIFVLCAAYVFLFVGATSQLRFF